VSPGRKDEKFIPPKRSEGGKSFRVHNPQTDCRKAAGFFIGGLSPQPQPLPEKVRTGLPKGEGERKSLSPGRGI